MCALTKTSYPRELFVISDLHIGGKYSDQGNGRGFRINTHVDQLVKFIHEIKQYAAARRLHTELVINGDFVDFLAEEVPTDNHRRSFIANENEAVATFDAIAARDRAVFDALRALLVSGTALTIVLGNHDIELSLSRVREQLRAVLGADDGHRFRFVYDGEAYVVGDVLIEHGNRYDEWNVVDHDRLRRFRSECSRRLEISGDAKFFPPAGSELVEKMMNIIKEDYPFIDLLKPETEAAIPLLLALEPSYAGTANGIEALRLRRNAASHATVAPARPSQPGDIAATKTGQRFATLPNIFASRMNTSEVDELMELVEEAHNIRQEQAGNIAAGTMSRIMSFARLLTTDSYEKRLRVLLGSLRALQDDKSFDRSIDEQYTSHAQELANKGFSTIVFGHTHLTKEIELPGKAKYLNTGTWADLIRVPREIIDGKEGALQALEHFAEAIRTKQFADYLLFQPTFAHIHLDEHGRAIAATVRDFAPKTMNDL